MLKRFFPTNFVADIFSIDYDDLLLRGKKTLLFDLDNTIAPFDVKIPTDDIILFFKVLTQKGFSICIVSNNKKNRVDTYNEKLKLKVLAKAGKPKKRGILNAMSLANGTISTTVMIGDQLFTDIWVGNRIGFETILVSPIANRDEFTVKLKRGIEKIVFNKYLKYLEKNKF